MARAGLDTDAVVAAAAGLADEDGLQRLTLAALAARLGVRTPSLYAHVDGLGELRARLAERGARELARVLRDAATGRAGADALQAVAWAYRGYARAHPGTYAAMQTPSARPENEAAAREVLELVVATLRGYRLAPAVEIHAVRAVRAALHGFVTLEHEGGFALPVDLDESFGAMIAMLQAGLASLA